MKKCCPVMCTVITLLIIGGINWGLVGAFQFDLVQYLLGSWPILARIVYCLVGVAGIMGIIGAIKIHSSKCCKDGEKGEDCCCK
ncbi:MAG: hypothetical protein UR28_C0021G0008 [Candidatus Peregrinibacteria bacterium GW2011_GWF2_33_10]|nr:MAG: hypothetical protein UR28_C0021G0008 [Candidatus Peregrinibacteria bacterium GW2011_GWF2_33_10]OGJ44101.1 MAG: hypothetical protein A2272_00340 [Candidatus Peregrinibacteria bacterium RIFOXYA12_FULL_33_12]OGJ44380.1 MAG: hypothetical protein A2263_05830 [Candidatus Peregrinibacteria bacterium RIFOXYA2_FULL_33_21]OGJ50175.1 MAG: hypothetical protein A2307_03320 [Candidatus Peregrinibacteria bacterium RIFOXYB2_FULL_33_20]